jgi:ABC-type amino acid transport substrate-binding protein
MTILHLRNELKWQKTAHEKCELAFKDFMDRLEALEEGDGDALAAAVEMTSKAPANLQDPVMTRWGTILAAVAFFADNWVVIYFFAMTLANSEKSNLHLSVMCCAMLSLMHNTKLEPSSKNNSVKNEHDLPTADGKEIDQFLASINTEESGAKELKKGSHTPVFLAVIHFLDGFNKSFFSGEHISNLLLK